LGATLLQPTTQLQLRRKRLCRARLRRPGQSWMSLWEMPHSPIPSSCSLRRLAAPQALSLEECDRLLRQYSSTIAVLERAIPDLRVSLEWLSRLWLSQSPCSLTAAIRYRSSVRANKWRASGSIVYRRGRQATAPAKAAAAASRLPNRRSSEGFVQKQLRESAGPLPHSLRLDLFTVDCSPVISALLTLAHAACESHSLCGCANP